MLFKRKHEFKPDRTEDGTLKKLYLTPKQRKRLLKWCLVSMFLVLLSLVQDVVLSSSGQAAPEPRPAGGPERRHLVAE